MDFRFSDDQQAFRDDVRGFIGDHWGEPPASLEPEFEDFAQTKRYEHELAERGWLTLAWPEEYGGQAASHLDQTIFREESAYAGAPSGGQGVLMVGPCIMVHGEPEQRQRFLPPISRGEVTWCQGFSEPGSGSDLASLQTRAVKDGDEYVINGQKIWTSGAQNADWIHLLARTNPDAPKHRGISYFLLDMKTPGIEVRPLIDLAGGHVVNETFFTDVRVPADQMLGEEDRGWYVATTLLDFERSGIGGAATARRTVDELVNWVRGESQAMTPDVKASARNFLSEAYVETEVARSLGYRVSWMQGQGLIPNQEASMAKMYGSELGQRTANRGMGLLGLSSQLVDRDDPRAPLQARLARLHMTLIPTTIAGGSSEIQRNIIATRGLGLPRE
ncbi:MAG TPA: acyl-CoA dehydrogenase family protein [Dehalococcoidia bacterium]|nr:acyl-CoA dehydrogenase family protein [Dehalococcoidia bacterium]